MSLEFAAKTEKVWSASVSCGWGRGAVVLASEGSREVNIK